MLNNNTNDVNILVFAREFYKNRSTGEKEEIESMFSELKRNIRRRLANCNFTLGIVNWIGKVVHDRNIITNSCIINIGVGFDFSSTNSNYWRDSDTTITVTPHMFSLASGENIVEESLKKLKKTIRSTPSDNKIGIIDLGLVS